MAHIDHVRAGILTLKTCYNDAKKLKLLAHSFYNASLRLADYEIPLLVAIKSAGSEQLGRELIALYNLEKFYNEKWKVVAVLFRLGIVNPIRQMLQEQR